MTILAPNIENMGSDVPTVCPRCHYRDLYSSLSDAQKQFLIDVTHYNQMAIEYRHLATLDSLLGRYPGTQNPLLRSKVRQRKRSGPADESRVAEFLTSRPEFREFLKKSEFNLDARYEWVQSVVLESAATVRTLLVTCQHCPQQYVVLPDYYFHAICLPMTSKSR